MLMLVSLCYKMCERVISNSMVGPGNQMLHLLMVKKVPGPGQCV